MLGRPSTNRQDVKLDLVETAPGRYEAQAAALLAEGSWLIALEARAAAADRRARLPYPEAPVAQPMTLRLATGIRSTR